MSCSQLNSRRVKRAAKHLKIGTAWDFPGGLLVKNPTCQRDSDLEDRVLDTAGAGEGGRD